MNLEERRATANIKLFHSGVGCGRTGGIVPKAFNTKMEALSFRDFKFDGPHVDINIDLTSEFALELGSKETLSHAGLDSRLSTPLIHLGGADRGMIESATESDESSERAEIFVELLVLKLSLALSVLMITQS